MMHSGFLPVARPNLQRRHVILLLLFFLTVYILPLGAHDLLTPHETRYAEIPREMIAGGDWITPHLNGLRYLEKPPLEYWIDAGALLLLGQTNFAVRFPSAMAVALTAVTICCLVRAAALESEDKRRFTALSAAIIFLSCFGVAAVGNLVVCDSLFTFFLTVSVAAFYLGSEAIARSRREKGYLLFSGLACGLAFLSQGFLAFVFEGLVLVPYLIWQRRYRDLFRLGWLPLLVAVAMALPWSLRVYLQARNFWHYFFWNEPIRRFLADAPQQKALLRYFFMAAPVVFLPWTFVAPAAAAGVARLLKDPAPQGRLVRLAICWLVLPLLFFSVFKGRLSACILSCFPAFAILMAAGLSRKFDKGSFRVFDWGVGAASLFFAWALLALMATQYFNFQGLRVYDHLWKVTLVIDGLAAMVIFCLWSMDSHCGQSKVMLLGFGPLLLFLLVHFTIPPSLVAPNAPGRLLEKYRDRIKPDTVIISGQEAVGAACWYLKRDDVYVLGPAGEWTSGLQYQDTAGRLLNPDSAMRLIERNRTNTLLIVRKEKVDYLGQSPLRPIFEDDSGPGGFVVRGY
jgi:4-amino-4-deoxy-L-arabinose transferase